LHSKFAPFFEKLLWLRQKTESNLKAVTVPIYNPTYNIEIAEIDKEEIMIKTVESLSFPIEEQFVIRKNRILPPGYDKARSGNGSDEGTAGLCDVGKKLEGAQLGDLKRLSIVTGIHGDELEGQYVCYEVARRIREDIQCLNGIVDIYPAINPLGIDSIERGVPGFDLDMNRIFPGNKDGSMVEHAAAGVVQDLAGSDMVIDIHASNLYLTEIPQARISELFEDRLVPYAEQMGLDFIWVHSASTVLEATLAHSLNSIGTPTIVVEMGIGLRLTQAYGRQLTDGIFSLMEYMGMWDPGKTKSGTSASSEGSGRSAAGIAEPLSSAAGTAKSGTRKPLISRNNDDVAYLNAPVSGVFIQHIEHNSFAHKGDVIGEIVDPLQGVSLCEVKAPCTGLIFTLRDFPMVDEGSLVGRMLRAEAMDPEQRAEYEARGVRPVSSLDLAKYRGGAQ
jgi:predicted deacylase